MKIFFLQCVSLLLLFLFLNISPSKDVNTLQQTFEVTAGGTLILDTDLGSIKIFTWEEPQVKIDVFREFSGWDEDEISDFLENFLIEFIQRDNTIEITGNLKNEWKKHPKNLSINFEIRIPQKFDLDLHTAGGSIWVDDLQGRVEAKTSGGSLKFGNVSGPILAKTSGGSISLKGCRMDADLRTSGGSISIGQVEGKVEAYSSGGSISIEKSMGSVIAKTSGGSITVEEVMGSIDAVTAGGSVSVFISKQPQENCRLETSGGTVNVTLAKGIALDIDARTHSGIVSSELAISITGSKKEDWLRGTLNGGGSELYLRTSGGNIYLHQR